MNANDDHLRAARIPDRALPRPGARPDGADAVAAGNDRRRAADALWGRAGIFTDLCESAREESLQLMLRHAKDLGANAVVGVRYDTGPMVGAAEVLCYGTAMVVEPIPVRI